MKRQRGDYCENINMNVGMIEPFGEDSVHELFSEGNPNITRGAFGEISIALQSTQIDGIVQFEFVAIKTIDQAVSSPRQIFGGAKQENNLSRDVFNELCALAHLSPHPNIVPLVALFPSKASSVSSTSLSLVFVYTPVDLYLTLEWRRRKCLPPLAFELIKAVAYDLFSALAHGHALGVLHRDIKPGNLLVSASGKIQLCDFGLAKPFLHNNSSSIPVPASGETGTKGLCTLFYRPPEVLLGGPADDPAIDMYSAGTVLAELVAGTPLFQGHNVLEQLSLVYDQLGTPTHDRWPKAQFLPDYGKLDFASREPKAWSQTLPRVIECDQLEVFLDRLVALDPSQRMSAAEALEHSFLHEKSHPSILRHELIQELIPPSLQSPPLLAPEDKVLMTRLALSMAARRRTFLLHHLASWTGIDLPESRLHEVIQCYQENEKNCSK